MTRPRRARVERTSGSRADPPDLAILLAAGYRALTERLAGAMEGRGIAGIRPSFGFVIRAVAAEQPTITRLAEMLDVTKQSASGLADEAERAGFIERVADPADRRSRHLRLTSKGEQVRVTALATSAQLERELEGELGAAGLDALRSGLLALVTSTGDLEDVLARRARLVW
ncbi:MAG: MarR family winged helix-turn-helix transcriptional regulator [Solirubrobacteraceae bacterium]